VVAQDPQGGLFDGLGEGQAAGTVLDVWASWRIAAFRASARGSRTR
jgi:hypothetical protein